jgi:hypothetical protein
MLKAKSNQKCASISLKVWHRDVQQQWKMLANEHSIAIPGDALEDPEQLEWIAEFSEGIGNITCLWRAGAIRVDRGV